jgi:hypothetical protein
MVLYALKYSQNVGNFILAYHHFFQVALCNDTHETCMKFALGVKTMSYHSLLALYFKRWNSNPPYLQQVHATMYLNVNLHHVSQKIKALLSFKGYLIPF